jgi:hypothetical protein
MKKDLPERECRYRGCGQKFTPKKKWQFFHSQRCHDLEWELKRAEQVQDILKLLEVEENGRHAGR